MTMTRQELEKMARRLMASAKENFNRDGHLVPIFFLEAADALIPLVPDYSTDEAKRKSWTLCAAAIIVHKARAVFAINESWYVALPKTEGEALLNQPGGIYPRPREHKDRKEAITLAALTKEHRLMGIFEIKRSPGNPAKLAEEHFNFMDGPTDGGDMSKVLTAAILAAENAGPDLIEVAKSLLESRSINRDISLK